MEEIIVGGQTNTSLPVIFTMQKGKEIAESVVLYEDPFLSILEDSIRLDSIPVTAPGSSIEEGDPADLMPQKLQASFSVSMPEPIPAAESDSTVEMSDSTVEMSSIEEADNKRNSNTSNISSNNCHGAIRHVKSSITSSDNYKPDIPLLTVDEDNRRRDLGDGTITKSSTITVSNATFGGQHQISAVDLLGIICENLPINKSEYCEIKSEKVFGSHEDKAGEDIQKARLRITEEVQLNCKNNELHTPLIRNKEGHHDSSISVPNAEFIGEVPSDKFYSIHTNFIENMVKSDITCNNQDATNNFQSNSIKKLICQGKSDASDSNIPASQTEELLNRDDTNSNKIMAVMVPIQMEVDAAENEKGLSDNTCFNSSPILSTLTTLSVHTHSSDSDFFSTLDESHIELDEASKGSGTKEDENRNERHQENKVNGDDDVSYESCHDHKKNSEVLEDDREKWNHSKAVAGHNDNNKGSETNSSVEFSILSSTTLPTTADMKILFSDVENKSSSSAAEDLSVNLDKNILLPVGSIPSIPGELNISDDFIGIDNLPGNEKTIALMACDNTPCTDDDFQVLVINSDKDDTKNIHDSEKLENISTNHSVIISDQNKFVEVPDFGDFERLSSEVEIEKRDGMLSGRKNLDEKIRLNEKTG